MFDLVNSITIAVCALILLIGLIAFILYATGAIKPSSKTDKSEDDKKRPPRRYRAF